ncbi:MAG TPA: ABC transporter substrate-binding protein [Chloroflexota bacterium]|nr:ABC transporter substrate-binding protein [Chloroflexota bacterium]
MIGLRAVGLLLIAAGAIACAEPAAQGRPANAVAPSQQESRQLVIAIHDEPDTLALHPFTQPGQATYLIKRVFNAQLSYMDNEANPHPYLAEALPALETDSWKVFPDGRMETTWKLRDGATWHDGTPLTAEDFVFTWNVYSTPELGHSRTPPFDALDGVSAADPRTIVFAWKRPFPGAATMYEHNREYPPLPRHILETAFQQNTPDAFLNLPYWTVEFVGVGPYRLDRWEPGQFIEASGFAKHALGPPKIGRVRLVFMADSNAVLASLFSGDIQLTADAAARLSEVQLLKQDWVPSGAGAVNLHINQYRGIYIQFRSDILEQKALLDPKVRAALFHAADRQAINESVYGGEAILGDFLVPPLSEIGRAADRALVKYPLDPRRSEQLMAEAGYARGADGIFVSPTAGRFGVQVVTQAAADNISEIAVLADGWQRAGFGVEQRQLTGAASRQPDVLASFPDMLINSTAAGVGLINDFKISNIPTKDNRWNGSNRGGWANTEYTSLADTFATTLDHGQQIERVGQIAKIFSEQLPVLTLFYRSVVFAHTSALTGVTNAPPESTVPWNMQDWELR